MKLIIIMKVIGIIVSLLAITLWLEVLISYIMYNEISRFDIIGSISLVIMRVTIYMIQIINSK
jgi:hypothetical protein